MYLHPIPFFPPAKAMRRFAVKLSKHEKMHKIIK